MFSLDKNDKEEELLFGNEESGKIRMLGSWMGWKEDVEERLKRGNKAWWKTKNRLRGAKFSKRLQARVVEASVESSLLFDSQARVWNTGEINRLQKQVDRAYRYVWSRGNEPPLMQMQREKRNMADVRKELKVKSLRWKIEKRALERLGHVMRMDNGRMTKALVLGWMEDLEKWGKKGRVRKTVNYWKKLVREAGWDYTQIGKLTADRKQWKRMVGERMKHLDEYEKSKGNKWSGPWIQRNKIMETPTSLVCEDCGKECRSKGGLTNHRKRMHNVSKLKKSFECKKCSSSFPQEANLLNHLKFNGECRQEEVRAKKYVAKKKECPYCRKEMAATNISRHIREACKGSEASL